MHQNKHLAEMKILIIASVIVSAIATAVNHSAFNDTTFLKLKDNVYVTPAMLWLGHDNGTVVRCLQEDTEHCEVFHQASGKIVDVVATGEYIYVAIDSGEILRCNITECKSYVWVGWLFSLAIGKGHFFAGHDNGAISICELNQPKSCRYTVNDSPARSLLQMDEYLYAGLINGLLMRFTLEDSRWVPVYNMTDTVMSVVGFENSIFAVAYNGRLGNCSRSVSESKCELRWLEYCHPWDMAAHNSSLYIQEYGITKICDIITDDSLVYHSNYAYRMGAWRFAFTYRTHHIQSRYKNEDKICSYEGDSRCSLVIYYDEEQRTSLEVNVKNGRLYNSHGSLVDTTHGDTGHGGPAAIFVMGPDGRLLLSNLHQKGFIHSSSLLAGNPVSGAGEMVVERGVIKKIVACSDHYKPNIELNKQVIQSLRTQGYRDPIELEACCEGDECHQVQVGTKI